MTADRSLSLHVDGREVTLGSLRFELAYYLATHPEIDGGHLESLQVHFGSGQLVVQQLPKRKKDTVRVGHGTTTTVQH